jgi:hypothetical protein
MLETPILVGLILLAIVAVLSLTDGELRPTWRSCRSYCESLEALISPAGHQTKHCMHKDHRWRLRA